PWWNKAQRSADNAMPTSNVIGKVRFIPVFRSKAVLVLAPSEYHDALRTVIENLDKPAKQVLVKAVLLSVNHENATSLGLKVSSNPDAFGALGDNMLEAFNTLTFGESYGALRLDSSLPVNVLVDLLVKHANARILNQPRIWTKDNDEAIFFKGRSVPFIEGSQSSTEGTSIRQDVKYRNVGVTLRVRPNITPEKAVDLTINLMVSEVEPQTINGNIVTTLMDNTTNMIVSDGQTLMLSGILTQVDRDIETKVPLIGDIPILGGLFRHTDQVKSNEELIAFITPYVFDENTTPDARGETQDALDKMHLEQETLNTTMQKLY
ncbi:MAG: type II secretion system protein GspD, partial [Sedimentisphaerales bacterium]|nr:type II secretion system protein GspD [Sedimentisphaerales bacterium]